MPKRLSIASAERYCKENKLEMVVILAYDGTLQHVVSYGSTKKNCELAAKSAEAFKAALGFNGPAEDVLEEAYQIYLNSITDDKPMLYKDAWLAGVQFGKSLPKSV